MIRAITETGTEKKTVNKSAYFHEKQHFYGDLTDKRKFTKQNCGGKPF